jgi:hypothetical protein
VTVVTLDAMSARARALHPARAVATLIAVVLFAAGWTCARVVTAAVAAVLWSAAAVQLGWRDVRPPNATPKK